MDSITEKFDLLDFFNLIISGAVFGVGVGFCDPFIAEHLNALKNWTDNSTFALILVITAFIVLCYIIESIFTVLGTNYLRSKFHISKVQNCLNDPEIVGNKQKLNHYRSNARKFFNKNGTAIMETEDFTPEQNDCYFAYCVYFIQTRSQEKKQKNCAVSQVCQGY